LEITKEITNMMKINYSKWKDRINLFIGLKDAMLMLMNLKRIFYFERYRRRKLEDEPDVVLKSNLTFFRAICYDHPTAPLNIVKYDSIKIHKFNISLSPSDSPMKFE
jgi:hypothetical protein